MNNSRNECRKSNRALTFFTICLSICFLFASEFISVVNAKSFNYNLAVTSGKWTDIDTYTGWNKDCSFLTFNLDVLQKPHAGRTTVKVVKSKISKADTGRAGKCLGKPGQGLKLMYRSNKGYRGSDSFKIRVKAKGYDTLYYNFNINVK